MNLEERLKKAAPDASKGGDKTLLEADGGLDLSKDEKAIKKANGGDIGQGGAGNNPSKPYSDKFK